MYQTEIAFQGNKLRLKRYMKNIVAYIIMAAVFLYISFLGNKLEFDTRKYELITSSQVHTFNLQVAESIEQKARGLMNVKSLQANEGMIFINQTPNISSFWMKNTWIPLDFLFIDDTNHIVHLHKNATPYDEFHNISSMVPVKYTIEINAGLIEALNIKIGDTIALLK